MALGLVLVATATPRARAAGTVPDPESRLGFRPGADFRLATWRQVVSYFDAVDEASDRVRVRRLGETTEGRPYVVAIVSSAETIRDLDRYRAWQAQLSDPRTIASDDERKTALASSKPVVVITCSIHSSETASTLMATELLHQLASADDPATREVLDNTILALVPSANPDGVDKVAAWYERTKGRPWEGSGMPELYHKYAGHDTNRDWFMLNLKETQLFTRFLYKDWFPTLLYDVHQMGSKGARIFVPPFFDPVNPNLDPRLSQGIFLIGAHMASDLAAAGKTGVLYSAQYDNWWNGGNRTTPQRHNIVAVLTEAASVKLASPIFLGPDDLKGGARGFPDHRRAVNFADPWPGGWWRLRDIVDYELVCARSLLTLAARYRAGFQSNLLAMASNAVKAGQTQPPYAWVVPRDQRDPGSAAGLVRILHDTGVEVRAAREPFRAGGRGFPAGTWVLPAAQPYRAHLKDMMERQHYPTRLSAGGKAEAPYDVAGWTLPLQMGVSAFELADPLTVATETVETVTAPKGGIDADGKSETPPYFQIPNTANDDFVVRMALKRAGVESWSIPDPSSSSPGPRGQVVIFRADDMVRKVLDGVLGTVSTRVAPCRRPPDLPAGALWPGGGPEFKNRRVAVYQPWVPSMDEGWTRLVLEQFKVPYKTVHDGEVRAGALREFDVLLLASIPAKTLKDGYAPNESEPAYVGGLGDEGVAEIRRFVTGGGRLVCLDASCEFAIETLGLPVVDVLKGVSSSDFYGPGSILRAKVEARDDPITLGMPDEVFVYFDASHAFEGVPAKGVMDILLRYATTDPLESGWLLGPSKLAGKAALVRTRLGKGQVILFGFPPQHRGQTRGTYRLLFNALLD
jgi:hypothetical protein